MKSYGKNIHIIGFAGTEGAALLEYLHQKYPKASLTAHNFCEKNHFIRHFRNAHVAMDKAEALEKAKEIQDLEGVDYCYQDEYLQGIEEADTLFVPQSWYLYPENEKLKKHKEKMHSITRLYFDLFPGKIIGVTGSNGKTTTTNMIAKVMQEHFPSTLFSGNDRRASQVLEQIDLADENDWLVLEISNRQLMFDLGKSPDISVITNITPNHLEEHGSFEAYAEVKASLLKYQGCSQWSVLNDDDAESKKLIERDDGETMPFSTEEILPKGAFVQHGQIIVKHADLEEEVMDVSDLPLKGKHNLSNALAAVAACYLADVPVDQIAISLRSMDPLPQRMELVETINGVEYYNDTASTVPESTIAAIEALKKPDQKLTLIMGGKSKGSDYSELVNILNKKVDQLIVLESPLSAQLSLSTLDSRLSTKTCSSLKQAIDTAKSNSRPGDTILLSPAAEYFVYFKDKMPDYKQFRHILKTLKGE